MKILWVNANFLHPTNKGGLIRTLGILRPLSRRHEIHYVAYRDPAYPEAPRRAGEYSFRAYPVEHGITEKHSPRFALEIAKGLVSAAPVAVSRFDSPQLRACLTGLLSRESFDRAVVDHLAPAAAYPDLPHSLLFQHNVETVIWERNAEHARGPLKRAYFRLQARRMFAFERKACLEAGHVAAVSKVDADLIRKMFGAEEVSVAPTGVDIDYFLPPPVSDRIADVAFVGSMDWLANVDGVTWFAEQVLPRIRQMRPGCRFAIAGRKPPKEILELARRDPNVIVTGTVPDVRPYLWGSAVSIVPLRIGGGTRMKIYEAMAAKVPVVSTRVGAEGLDVTPGENIRIADTPEEFAETCLELIEDRAAAQKVAAAAREMVAARFSWEKIAEEFERILLRTPAASRREMAQKGASI